uniref:Uncharacterized protein n=1 Tax=Anopheles farauti TaxID=69004 RepID=A0A182QRP4_9DIPT
MLMRGRIGNGGSEKISLVLSMVESRSTSAAPAIRPWDTLVYNPVVPVRSGFSIGEGVACCKRGDATDDSESEEEDDDEQLCDDRLLGLRNTLSASFGIGSVCTVSGTLFASPPNAAASFTSAADDIVAEKNAFDSGEDVLRVSSINTCASSRKSRFILDVPSTEVGFDSAKKLSSVLNSSEQ